MSSNRSGRVLVAATLAAALFLAVPVQAIDGRGAALGSLERLVAWFVETWLSAELTMESQPPPPPPPVEEEDEEDPEGCRGDYTACVDPNG
jgi:hypothetical protein